MEQRAGHYMPPSLLDSQLATLEALQPDELGCALSGEVPSGRIVDDVATRFGITSGRQPHETGPMRSTSGEGSPAT